jgi:hypothetical protein
MDIKLTLLALTLVGVVSLSSGYKQKDEDLQFEMIAAEGYDRPKAASKPVPSLGSAPRQSHWYENIKDSEVDRLREKARQFKSRNKRFD